MPLTYVLSNEPGDRLKMLSYRYRDSHKDRTVVTLHYLYQGNPLYLQRRSLFLDGAKVTCDRGIGLASPRILGVRKQYADKILAITTKCSEILKHDGHTILLMRWRTPLSEMDIYIYIYIKKTLNLVRKVSIANISLFVMAIISIV